jgi:hypothetical protein
MDDNTDLKGSMMIGAEAVSNKDNAREFPSQFQDPFLQNRIRISKSLLEMLLLFYIVAGSLNTLYVIQTTTYSIMTTTKFKVLQKRILKL